jgi:predicted phosphodiesterase
VRYRRIGIIGDVHGQARNLARALDSLADRAVDSVVSVGDIVDGPESIDECCHLLMRHHVIAVRGNHERWMFTGQMRSVSNATSIGSLKRRSREFLASLPAVRVLPVVGGTVVLSHGIDEDDMRELPRRPDTRLVTTLRRSGVIPVSCVALISGHSHRRGSIRVAGTTLVEAGTLLPWRGPCYGILDCPSNRVTFHPV